MADEERYEIQGKIGQGGLGSIYRAHDRQLNRTVAIKRINPDPDADPEEAIDAIVKESRALSALSSTNIVSIFDIDQDEDGPYVVMEYLEGETLEDLVNRAPLVENDFVSTAEQALEGLLAAHAQQITHRDIKPSNIMYTWLPSGSFLLKILDFGLAKFASEPSVQTVAHGKSLMGSIYYMAPEQFSRKPLDVRTDLYSLGCVLYYSITGNNPFEGENATEVMAGHIQGKYPPLDEIRPDFHPEFLRWIDTLMALDPDDRFANAQEAIDALAAAKAVRKATGPVTTTVSVSADRPVLATGPIPTTGTNQEDPETSTTTNPLAVTLPTTGLPVWLIILVGVLAAVILVLSTVALMSGRKLQPDSEAVTQEKTVKNQEEQPKEEPPAKKPTPAPEPTPEPSPPKPTRPTANNTQTSTKAYKVLLRRLDKNNDGRIALEECPHLGGEYIIEKYKERLVILDTNKNNFLEPAEIHLQSKRPEVIAAITPHDADESGGLSIEEFRSYIKTSPLPDADSKRFSDLDLDKNGELDPAEYEVARLSPWIWRIFQL